MLMSGLPRGRKTFKSLERGDFDCFGSCIRSSDPQAQFNYPYGVEFSPGGKFEPNSRTSEIRSSSQSLPDQTRTFGPTGGIRTRQLFLRALAKKISELQILSFRLESWMEGDPPQVANFMPPSVASGRHASSSSNRAYVSGWVARLAEAINAECRGTNRCIASISSADAHATKAAAATATAAAAAIVSD